MLVDGKHYRTIWSERRSEISIIDQTQLPHKLVLITLKTFLECAHAIRTMQVRGAPLIGIAGAYGIYLAMCEDPSDAYLQQSYDVLLATRPTAVNLQWALNQMRETLLEVAVELRETIALKTANRLANEDIAINHQIGKNTLGLLRNLWERKKKSQTLNILTHCNAGWLATVDWGTALSGVYQAFNAGIPIHVWVDETRPRNQGASLTAWELQKQGVPFTVIVDNMGGLLMQQGKVDCCIVGTDRTTRCGDVCNKIGTYLKALAAHDNSIPFYVAAPWSSIDFSLERGGEIIIEERSADEVTHISGLNECGESVAVRILPLNASIQNAGFDITPARLVTSIITEYGIASASEEGLLNLHRERYFRVC